MHSSIRIVSSAQVARLLPMADAIPLMARTFEAVSAGRAQLPLRMAVQAPAPQNRLGVMPGCLDEPGALGVKVVALFPNAASHAGFILLFDPNSGAPLALVNAGEITALRTAAASAAATRVLANPGAADLAILGTGVQAAAHLKAMAHARPLSRIRVWGRSPDKALAFAAAHGDDAPVPIEAMPSARAAVDGASLICTTTSSPTPILEGAWVSSGAHVNLVGSSFPTTREVDTPLVVRSRYYVDYLASALAQAGELKAAMDEGLVNADHIRGEVGQVLLSQVAGRETPGDVTVFKSLGNAAQDLASARWVYDRATETGDGVAVEI